MWLQSCWPYSFVLNYNLCHPACQTLSGYRFRISSSPFWKGHRSPIVTRLAWGEHDPKHNTYDYLLYSKSIIHALKEKERTRKMKARIIDKIRFVDFNSWLNGFLLILTFIFRNDFKKLPCIFSLLLCLAKKVAILQKNWILNWLFCLFQAC